MKSKMIAVVMAVLMVATATAVVASGNTDADDLTRDVYVGVGGSVDVVFNIVEPDSSYYSNSVEWNDTAVNTKATVVDNANYMIEIVGSNGTYTATVTGKAAAAQTVQTLTYEITSTIGGSPNAGSAVQTLVYTLNIIVGSPLKTDFTLTGTEGTAISADMTVTTETSDFQFAYYAVDLPKGVQMNPQGTISGTPLEYGTGQFTVIATHKASNMTSTYTYSYNIAAATPTDDSFTFTVGGNTAKDGDKFIVASNDTIEVVTTVGGSAANITSFDLINVDDEDDRTPVTGSNGTYTIKSTETSGTGSYIVVMTNGDVTHSFELVVVANPYDLDTGIGFNPGSQ